MKSMTPDLPKMGLKIAFKIPKTAPVISVPKTKMPLKNTPKMKKVAGFMKKNPTKAPGFSIGQP